MKVPYILLTGIALMSLTGCQPPLTWEQQLSIYRAKCMDFGFAPGSVEFAECVQGQDQQAIDVAERERDRQNKAAIAQQEINARNWQQQQALRAKKHR